MCNLRGRLVLVLASALPKQDEQQYETGKHVRLLLLLLLLVPVDSGLLARVRDLTSTAASFALV